MEAGFSLPPLKDVPEVSGMSTTAVSTAPRRHETSSDAVTTRAPVVKLSRLTSTAAAAFSTTAPSSSNGETFLHYTSNAADSTADPRDARLDEMQTPHIACHGGFTTTAIELSPSLSALHSERDEEENEEVSSLAHSAIVATDDDDVEDVADIHANTPSQLAQSVWTRQVRIESSSTGRGLENIGGNGVLSEAASRVIAHALHRASLLRRCFTQWQTQRERQRAHRQHQLLFARDYYERNLRYLLFRAWQWGYCCRHRRSVATQQAGRLRHTQLCRRALRLWRAWRQRQQENRQHVQQLLLAERATLRLRYFEKWQQHCRRQAQASTLERVRVMEVQRRFLVRWRSAVTHRHRSRLLLDIVALHTPAAWSVDTEAATRELALRCSWIQWLRVTMARRAARLQRRAAATARVSASTVQAHLRWRYVRWLRVTLAGLQSRQLQRQLQRRVFQDWTHRARLTLHAEQWVKEVQRPRVVRRCLDLWQGRCRARQQQHTLLRLVELFTASVVNVRAVSGVFHVWRQRWAARERSRRMRRVAEAYARPALLRHLFARHVTDGVLGGFAAPLDVDCEFTSVDVHGGNSTESLETAAGLRGANEAPVSPFTALFTAARPSMRPPIPLRLSHHSPRSTNSVEVTATNTTTTARSTTESPVSSVKGPVRCPPVAASLPSPREGSVHAQALLSAAPPCIDALTPPPTYEEVMNTEPLAAALAAAAPPPRHAVDPKSTRSDVGVGTENEVHAGYAYEVRHDPPGALGGVAGGKLGASLTSPSASGFTGLVSLPATTDVAPPFYVPYGFPYPAPPPWCPPPHPSLFWQPPFPATAAAAATTEAEVRVPPHGLTSSLLGEKAGADNVHGGEQRHRHVAADTSALPVGAPLFHGPATPSAEPVPSAAYGGVFSPLPSRDMEHHVTPADSHTKTTASRPAPPLRPLQEVEGACHVRPSSPTAAATAADPSPMLPVVSSPLAPRPQRSATSLPQASPSSAESDGLRAGGREKCRQEHRADRPRSSMRPYAANTVDGTECVQDSVTPLSSPRQPDRDHGCAFAPHATMTGMHSTSTPLPSAALLPGFGDDALLPSFDTAALRLTARTLLDDYRQRTRLLPSEQAELSTVQSRLALERQLGLSTTRSEEALKDRERHLRRRLVVWQQRRAQVAQLTTVLASQVTVKTSRDASQAGGCRGGS